MGELKQINIKNWAYYCYNDIIDLDELVGSKIKVDKKDFNDIDIYYVGYEYKKNITECNEINTCKPLYLRITDMEGQFNKGKGNNIWLLIIYGDADVSGNLKIFGKVLELKLKKIQMVLYSMIQII